MTAIKDFQRLEAAGLYFPEPGSQRRDVFLSLGDASLTIIDQRSSALSHWSLAAVERVNPGRRPAIYAPGTDTPERIETNDEIMIHAIERVRKAVDRRRPHPGRVRTRLIVLLCLGVAGLALFWLPGAITRYAASILPPATRTAIGDDILDHLDRVAGASCDEAAGLGALQTLSARLSAEQPAQIRVMRSGVAESAHLPGQIVLLSRSVVEDHEQPEVVAGYILAETERAARTDPMISLLDHAGITATIAIITTGSLPEGAIDGYAEALLSSAPAALPAEALLPRFSAAGVPSSPYAYAVDVTGETTLPLIEADPVLPENAEPLLSDEDWVALQAICIT